MFAMAHFSVMNNLICKMTYLLMDENMLRNPASEWANEFMLE